MAKERTIITEESVPRLARSVRLHDDWARQRNVLLAPERVIALDDAASNILSRCDGSQSVKSIVDQLQQIYRGDRSDILRDVCATLQELLDKRYVVDLQKVPPGERANPQAQHRLAPARSGAKNAETLPISVLAELTHRCPLQCPYCSNPVDLERASAELGTEEWKRLIDECAALGVLQIHFSGGEPLVRKDLIELVNHATAAGLYSNLITSGVLLHRENLSALMDAGLDHVQISFQGQEEKGADTFAGFRGAYQKKREAASLVRELSLPLTVNAVVHRQNLHDLPGLIALAVELGAARLEVAHVQYLGWALKNRAALIPTMVQFEESSRIVEAARERFKGILVIDYVIPDYYAVRPKKCMGGWAERFFNITPSGIILPCHAAESITGLTFDSVRYHSLAWIWEESPAMLKYRGTGWMKEPCKSCEFREIDRGGCRCQAFALTGDAGNTDPTCAKSRHHEEIVAIATKGAKADIRNFDYRNFRQDPR